MRRLLLLALLPAAMVHADVIVRGGSGCTGTLIARSDDVVRTAAVSPEPFPLALDPQRSWSIVLESDDCWAAPTVIEPSAPQAEIAVWPRANLRGRLELPRGTANPAHITLRVQSAPKERALGPVEIECAVEKQRWSCGLPAAALDVRIAAEGFAPHYLWDLALTPREQRDLGRIELRQGASIGGWASADDGPITVELAPREFLRGPSERRSARSERVTPNRRGFFQFRGVAAGVYDVIATTPNRSRAMAEIEVSEIREHVLSAELALQPPARLNVSITPRLDPSGNPWVVTLEREIFGSNAVEPVTKGTAAEDGTWSREDVEPGHYVVTVRGDGGSLMDTKRVDVGTGDARVDLLLPLVAVRGTVTLGEEPLPASLRFDGNGTRAEMRTNDEGEFEGSLVRPGQWDIHVESRDGKFNVIRRVDVKAEDDGSETVIDIELPDGRVRGRVVDERGAPVDAMVMVYRDGRSQATARTSADGAFDMRGIERGAVLLRARHLQADTGLIPFDINDSASPVQLVLRQMALVSGWLTTGASEPVAGALVRYFAPTLPSRKETVTGPGGEFALELPPGTPAVSVVILAAGLPVKVAALRTDVAEAQQVVIGRQGGLLTMPMTRETPMPWMTANGAMPFPMSMLFFPSDGNGLPRGVRADGMAIDIEPGAYSICAGASQGCETVNISAGAETAVAPPAKG